MIGAKASSITGFLNDSDTYPAELQRVASSSVVYQCMSWDEKSEENNDILHLYTIINVFLSYCLTTNPNRNKLKLNYCTVATVLYCNILWYIDFSLQHAVSSQDLSLRVMHHGTFFATGCRQRQLGYVPVCQTCNELWWYWWKRKGVCALETGSGSVLPGVTNVILMTDLTGRPRQRCNVNVVFLHWLHTYSHCILDTCGHIFFLFFAHRQMQIATPAERKRATGGEEKGTKWMQNLV